MKKILAIFTGGTIGSKADQNTIDVYETAGSYLLELFQKNYNVDVEFELVQPFTILSENCEPFYWTKLCNTLNNYNFENYCGIIISHGTDTLSYTSALISMMFPHVKIPIVVTGSNYPLENKKSVGLYNFYNAVMFILNSRLSGIYSIFQDNRGKNIVFLGSRIREADSYEDQFSSYGGSPLGEIVDGEFKLYNSLINPTMETLLKTRNRVLFHDIRFEHEISAMQSYPGLNYDNYQFLKKPKAILHSLYHSGTGCVSKNSFSLPQFIERCSKEGIDFYLISFHDLDSDLYRSSREILNFGAIALQNISFEAAYTKLNVAYNQIEMNPKEFMKQEQFFEFLPVLD